MKAAGPQGVGQQQTVASGGQVQDPLGDHKAHPEEDIGGRQEGHPHQHQAQGQSPAGGGRSEVAGMDTSGSFCKSRSASRLDDTATFAVVFVRVHTRDKLYNDLA